MALESPILRDGDAGFIGYASRLNPAGLPAGMLQLSENMRLDRGVAKVRKGLKRMADNIAPGQVPLTVPFVLAPAPDEPVVRDSYTGGIFASCVLRSPDAVNSMEAVVLAGSDRAYTVLTDGSIKTSKTWTDGVLWDGTDTIVDEAGNELVISTLPAELAYPTGTAAETVEATDNVCMLQAWNRLYLLREADTTVDGWGAKTITSGGISVAGTAATVNLTGHGYPAGARVRIEGSASAAFDGQEYDIATAATNSFTVTVPGGTVQDTATTSMTCRRVKAPLYWDGQPGTSFVRSAAGIPATGPSYKHLRSVGWASYINGRLVAPDGRDQVMLSDIYDPDTFDPYWQSFRANAGSNDYIVGVYPWTEGAALVFCRKSIWIATISQFPSADGSAAGIDTAASKLEILTDEVGCAARRSIQRAGQFVYFLSDAGVYRLDTQLDLKLRGDTKPLSDPISDQIAGLNAALVEDSVGLWFDNRYYLAVPLAGADANNGVFIYNALNDAWETRDIIGVGVDNFLVATVEDQRRVLISNRAGRLMMMDEQEAGDDSPSAAAATVTAVPGKITTRRYGMGTMHAKRFLRVLTDAVLPPGAAVAVKVATINPDKTLSVTQQANAGGAEEDYTLKSPVRAKAGAAEITYETSAGRPEIRTAQIEAAGDSLPATLTRTEA